MPVLGGKYGHGLRRAGAEEREAWGCADGVGRRRPRWRKRKMFARTRKVSSRREERAAEHALKN